MKRTSLFVNTSRNRLLRILVNTSEQRGRRFPIRLKNNTGPRDATFFSQREVNKFVSSSNELIARRSQTIFPDLSKIYACFLPPPSPRSEKSKA
ncbi:hypothetical protein TNIN_48421 [Trichonephila inaurata madagascariensis]|uniref:Uncharacterized protein n=1 Tax=Trichonephila inaurata madagascariensis TaxID=2747483 RepID=A0A8X7CH19_9ARAC|nr:hypothetical protein TNIN_48421 [Trichonephila inaurata madagascariensis]